MPCTPGAGEHQLRGVAGEGKRVEESVGKDGFSRSGEIPIAFCFQAFPLSLVLAMRLPPVV